ncbi:Mitochondrial transcription termination factor, mTERF [Handroanthus impetiginosus]|uniref:Mitochondrial transcription termination factor, mTERF n=1 Tax=Handroanthus impetiginosus TaxID=429701 RepID=A0A2G9G4Q5_9LAMI|nr:Mitochondrial transcription termination factor, mTERF [Handroanthus impetiginosus]PIN11192.1 Mitochondrial transcription termination factor, mTERF [Handroanthus impetiginosus]
MLSFNLHHKLFPIKKNVADSAALLVRLHKVQPFHGPTLIETTKNRTLVKFCSLVNVELSGAPPKLGNKKPKFSEKLAKNKSYTISYLINSCGLSPEAAIAASEKVCFENSEKPNFVLDLLEKNGFSKTQIATVVRKRPLILVAKETTLLPKFKFFQSIGMSKDFLAAIVTRDPSVLTRSLENHIIPNYNFLKSVLLTDERVAASMKRSSWVFVEDVGKSITPNVTVLREMKVPESCIRLLLTHFPETLMLKCDEFRVSVSRVSEMGFDPAKSGFVLALHAVSGAGNRMIWARCYEDYSKWGWSKDDIYMAFRKHPHCMIISQKKIHDTMDFLVNKMGLNSKIIAKTPTILLFSLEKRIIPRCSVVKLLSLRGLINKDFKLNTVLLPPEKCFLEKYVVKYEKEVPQLHDLYKGKIGIEDL